MQERSFGKSSKFPNHTKNVESFQFSDFQQNFIAQKKELSEVVNNTVESKAKVEENMKNSKINQIGSNSNEISQKKLVSAKNTNKPIILKLKKTVFTNNLECSPLMKNDLTYFKGKTFKTGKIMKKLLFAKKLFMRLLSQKNISDFLQNINKIKIIYPYEKLKIFWDIIVFFNTMGLFFYMPLISSFDIVSGLQKIAIQTFFFILYILDIFLTMNTAYFDNGILIQRRKDVLFDYGKKFLFLDIISLFSLIVMDENFNSNHGFSVFYLFFFARLRFFLNKYHKIIEFFNMNNKFQKGLLKLYIIINYLIIL